MTEKIYEIGDEIKIVVENDFANWNIMCNEVFYLFGNVKNNYNTDDQ